MAAIPNLKALERDKPVVLVWLVMRAWSVVRSMVMPALQSEKVTDPAGAAVQQIAVTIAGTVSRPELP